MCYHNLLTNFITYKTNKKFLKLIKILKNMYVFVLMIFKINPTFNCCHCDYSQRALNIMCSLVSKLQRCQFLSNCSASLNGQHIPFNRPNKVKIARRQKERKTQMKPTLHSLVMISWEVSVGWSFVPPSRPALCCLNPNLCANNDEAAAWCRRPSLAAQTAARGLMHCCLSVVAFGLSFGLDAKIKWLTFAEACCQPPSQVAKLPLCILSVADNGQLRLGLTTCNRTQLKLALVSESRLAKRVLHNHFDPLILPFRASIMNCKRSHVSAHEYRWMSHAVS